MSNVIAFVSREERRLNELRTRAMQLANAQQQADSQASETQLARQVLQSVRDVTQKYRAK